MPTTNVWTRQLPDTLNMSETEKFAVVSEGGASEEGGCGGGMCCHNVLGKVNLAAGEERGGHPQWYPTTEGVDTGLRVHNSLTSTNGETLDKFIPASGKKVMWYTCGPTVYDSCHMGHARAYLTMDILRRIMEDYFGYDITYHLNITDIDDKIILRARRNKLLDDYEAELCKGSAEASFAEASEKLDRALASKREKLTSKLAKVSEPCPADANSRVRDERDTQIKETQLKLLQLTEIDAKVALVRLVNKEGIAKVLAAVEAEAKAADAASPKAGDAALLVEALTDKRIALDDAIEATTEDAARAPVLAQRAALGILLGRAEALETVASAGGEALWKPLVMVGRSEIGELIDDEVGAGVTDHAVFNAHARKFEREYMEDMEALGVNEPDVLTRVTEYLPKIIDYVAKIVEKGLAYASATGSVYLDIEALKKAGHDYRKLVPSKGDTTEAEMAEGEGALGGDGAVEKKSPNDFALWKASKAGEPAWDSPWGMGRPGWHIECSVVASDILGENMDVHAGGVDLKFPHHDNELAQSEAYYGCKQWVNTFFHAGHLHIKGLKMSKSLKNFITIRQALKEHSPRQLRLMFLLQPWDKPMNYSDQTVGDAKSKEALFNNFFGEVKTLLRSDWLADEVGLRDREADLDLLRKIHETQTRVHEALCENFNTPGALAAMVELVAESNKYLRRPKNSPCVVLIRKAARYISGIMRVFGVIPGNDEIGFAVGGGGADKEATVEPFVQALIDFRDEVRAAARDGADKSVFLNACDTVRDETLTKLGVRLEDKDEKTIWKLDDPATLVREIEAKKAAEAEKKAAKLAKQRAAAAADLQKWETARLAPTDLFKAGPDAAQYTAFDEKGFPTTNKEGEPLAKAQLKKLQKMMKVHEKSHATLQKKAEGDIDGYIAGLREALEKMSL